MNIYLARHAQKDISDKTSPKDHFNREITSIGKKQAEALGHYFRAKNITKIYCSDMPRDLQTAEIVSNILKVDIVDKSHELREADSCLIPNHPQRDKIKILCWHNWNYKPPHGESYKEGKDRFTRYFKKGIINKLSKDDNVLIISHGRVLRLFLSDYLENGLEAIKPPYKYVAITHLRINSNSRKIKVLSYNDDSYLPNKLRF